METIRDALKKSLELTPIEEIETPEGTYKSGGILPLPLPYVVRSMALILYIDASIRTCQKTNKKIISCLQNDINPDSLMQGLQTMSFLKWWLDQEAKFHFSCEDEDDDDEGSAWYDLSDIAKKWNEWAAMENQRLGWGEQHEPR